jgi:hypothetical protein
VFQSKEFPTAPQFYPIFFGKCYPLFTYTSGPKGRNFILQKKKTLRRLPKIEGIAIGNALKDSSYVYVLKTNW